MRKNPTLQAIEAHLGASSWFRTIICFVLPWAALIAFALHARFVPPSNGWWRAFNFVVLGILSINAGKACELLGNDLGLRRQQKQIMRDVGELSPEYQEKLLVNLNRRKGKQ